MLRLLAIPLVASFLAGCAGSPVGDALAGPEKLAAADDSYCQSIGTRFGTPEYANCRMAQTNNRENRHAHRLGIAAQGMAIVAQPQPSVMPSTTTCRRVGAETVCDTR